jgi:hypothetical protein
VVTAGRFISELILLYTETRDTRFIEARNALYENGLLDQSGWRRRFVRSYERSYEEYVAVTVWGYVREGSSLRMACAELVWLWSWPGQSFEAACKELERLYRSYQEAGVDFGRLADEIMSDDRRE